MRKNVKIYEKNFVFPLHTRFCVNFQTIFINPPRFCNFKSKTLTRLTTIITIRLQNFSFLRASRRQNSNRSQRQQENYTLCVGECACNKCVVATNVPASNNAQVVSSGNARRLA